MIGQVEARRRQIGEGSVECPKEEYEGGVDCLAGREPTKVTAMTKMAMQK